MYRRKVLLILAMVLGLAACAPANPTQPTATDISTQVPTAAPTQKPALKNDPKNATYLIEGSPITFVDGVAETELAPGSASKQTTLYFGNEAELDLNADGLTDTAFLLTQDGGGTGTFFYVVVALRTADGYTGTNAIFLGDRIAPQSTSVDPNNSTQFVVSYADRAPDEPMSAQPSLMVSKTFKIENGTLVEVAAS